ncbi:recombinase family protein [Nocardia brasiliensis]|uniref:recombinase family protein n=1 Tax=Nocardia brasiliensis TaxID=37326 RepID=UPI0006913F15|nr:recombinase family protein [Nocardia brasiliensis]
MSTTKATAGKLTILRIAIYLRISQDRSGEKLGVARQESDCRKMAERLASERGVVVHIEVFTDNDTSAYSGKRRKDYERLTAAIAAGEFDMVITWHPDRLHRSPLELEHFISLIERTGTEVQTVQAGLWDLTTPSGRMVARQLGAVARYESEHKGERIKAARIQGAMAGKFHGGMRPYGFEPDGVTLRQDEAREIVRMYEQVVAGVSLRQIVADLNRREIPTATQRGPWTSVGVSDIIKRHRNAGWSAHKGEVVGKAVWPALVSEDTWHAANSVVNDPARRTSPGNTPKWLGSGLYLCGVCGQADLRAGVSGSGRRASYRCRSRELTTESHVSRDAGQVDALVEETVVARLERPDALAQLMVGQGHAGGDVAALRLEQAALRQRLDSLAEMFAAGEVDARQLSTASATLKAKVAEIDSALASLGMRSPLAELEGRDIRTTWFGTRDDRSDGLSLGHRRAIVGTLLTVTVLRAPKGRRVSGAYFDPEFIGLEWRR